MRRYFQRAIILGLAASPILALLIQPVAAQSLAQSAQSLITQAKETDAEYKLLCRKTDAIEKRIEAFVVSKEQAGQKLYDLTEASVALDDQNARVNRILEVQRSQGVSFAGNASERLNELAKKLATKSKRLNSQFILWIDYSQALEVEYSKIVTELGSVSDRKLKLGKHHSRLLELLKDLPKDPGTVAKDPNKIKLIEDVDEVIREGIDRLYPPVELILQKLQELEGEEISEDEFLDSEEYNKLLEKLSVSAGRKFAQRFTKDVDDLVKSVDELEADMEGLNQTRNAGVTESAPPVIEPAPKLNPESEVIRVPNTNQSPDDTDSQSPGDREVNPIHVATKANPFSQPSINLDISYRFQNIPDIDFQTADFFSGVGNEFEIAPDFLGGFGGKFQTRVPLDFFAENGPDNVFLDFQLDGNVIDGEERTSFLQAPGTQQVVGGINGTGTPFGLNTRTTFDTEIESYFVGGGIGAGISGQVIKDRLWFFTSVNLNGGFRSTDIDIDYSTGNAGGPTFNNFTNISADEFITRATLGLGAKYIVPGTNEAIEINADGKIGPSLHFGDFDFSDCGSTDGTGGACNGGFFRTNLNTSTTDVGLYSELNLGVAARLGKRFKLEANGGVIIQDLYEFDLNSNVATTPGAVVSVGGVSPRLETNVGFSIGARATISLNPTTGYQ